MSLVEFIKLYADKKDDLTRIILKWYWKMDGYDEEYSFDGKPSEFIEKYTKDYNCLNGFDIYNVYELEILNHGCNTQILINIVSE